ncbi:ATP-binding cassette domain-containing protein [Vibrio hannami]|uniref:ATP-binding cassette domain-containing protein n=1 Tax=Vibrio hannami TaxID=2717094 RepID=UPI00240F32F5|nr:ATP-binding cassette domain-containing protein [Vibrio hannami]MDG3088340.1 ATP-binding cassette domain-containing protein [Vibrio hannami]
MSLFLNNLTISKISGEPLFEPLSLQIDNSEVVTLMGPSGCGKSTLLSAIAGHLSNEFGYTGDILLGEKRINDIPAYKRKVGILFQDDLLFPHLRVWENLAFALPDSVKAEDRKQQSLQSLGKVDLMHIANSFPDQISGGQRARISLLRMLMAKPEVALLDEPFSKLDKELRQNFRQWVFEQLKTANIPTLMVTHDIEDAPKDSCTLTWPWK